MRKVCILAALAIGIGSLPLPGKATIWAGYTAAGKSQDTHGARFVADNDALRTRLAMAPHEVLLDRSLRIDLPMPDGSLQSFSVVESPIMPRAIGRRFADMKTFKLRGIDDPSVSGRADLTVKGFRAMLSTRDGLVFIDPEAGAGNFYRSSQREAAAGRGFACGVHGMQQSPVAHVARTAKPANRLAMNYQTYRIAVAATNDYVAAVGGSSADARAEILTAINRVNEFYERDLGIRLLLVANDGTLLERESGRCFTNEDETAMLLENQVWIDERIGSAAYDIGHVFGTSNGGIAFLGSACDDQVKAGGVTGLPNPIGDAFYIDFVAHEIGHQLNAQHIFNGTTSACGGGNRNAATAVEPGSGSTIMSYAGICGLENLQPNSDTTFHALSIAEIDAFTAGGGSCRGTLANGNNDPTVTPLVNRTIPAQTPFRLEAAASDIDGDTLSYQWDQMDGNGNATNSVTFGTDLVTNPLFRSYQPQTDFWRDFPALGTQLRGQTDKAEVLPAVARTLTFRVTARDNNSGQQTADITLNVVAGTGFRVTSPNDGTLDTTTTPYTITWDPAGTESGSTVDCANVDIDLLTLSDSSYTSYSVHSIATGVTNNGSANIATPLAGSHSRARVRIKCSDNVFYDISDNDVNVTGTAGTLDDNDFTTFFNNNGITVSREAPVRGGLIEPFASPARSAARIESCRSFSGDASALEPLWLLSLSGLVVLVRLVRRYGLQ